MDRLSYGAYLYALEPDVLAVLTMHGEFLLTAQPFHLALTKFLTYNATTTRMAATGLALAANSMCF